jgi:hypothetical protein
MDYLRNFTIKNFLLYFCVAYTFFDVTGAIVAGLNRTRGGIVADQEVVSSKTNNAVNFVISVKPLEK